jgi:sugar/nucleoside kinase (ribokinase family)
MSLLVTGSIGIDTVTTPFGTSENCLGGSAIYFSLSACLFSPVRFIGAVGADCPFDLQQVFEGRDVDLAGLEVRQMSKTFRWKGSYHDTMNEAITDDVQLNVLAEDPPVVPEVYKDSKFVFLANTHPVLQKQLLSQVDEPLFVAADSMNCWIHDHINELQELLNEIDALIINEDEAKALARQTNLIKAADEILTMGPSAVVIKKGESGSLTCNNKGEKFILPAFPAEMVKDPTGAGDSFAGALMGYLASTGKTDFETLKAAVAYGTVAASFTISDFSVDGINSVTKENLKERFDILRKLTQF